MDYLSFYLFSKGLKIENSNLDIKFLNEIGYAISTKNENQVNRVEDEKKLLISHTNPAIKRKLINSFRSHDNYFADNEPDPAFCWGFYALLDKENSTFYVRNDPFGIYPLYYFSSGKDFLLSNNLDGMIGTLGSLHLNIDGIYDYFLFNYTLKSRTLIKEISRIQGGSTIELNDFQLKIRIAEVSNIIFPSKHEGSGSMAEAVSYNILENFDPALPTLMPLTGGFDSKIILAVLLSKKFNFSTFTFGNKYSNDFKAASAISAQYELPNILLEMDQEFLNSIDSQIDDFIGFSPNAPMLDTLLYYQVIRKRYSGFNYICGIMGGEMIVGPVLISELITTKSSALLGTCADRTSLHSGLLNNIRELKILDGRFFKRNLIDYTEPVLDYCKNPSNRSQENIIRFLLKETYAKFFGVVFAHLFTGNNFIAPLTDPGFLTALFRSEYRFQKPYTKSPMAHFRSRKLYPEIIKEIEPSVLNSMMDRGYNLEDFLKWYKFYKPFTNYFTRHYLNKKSKQQEKIIYLEILQMKALERITHSEIVDWKVFDKDSLLKTVEDVRMGKGSVLQKKCLLRLLFLTYFIEKYSG
jgi:hypothetical protein